VAEIKIDAEPRTEFGKGAARRLRRNQQVPGVLYELGQEPIHVALPGHALMLALKNSNALLSVKVSGKSHLAIPKQVQREVLRGFIEHVDLLKVKRGEKVTVDIPVHAVGEAISGSLVVTEMSEITIEAEATHIPEYVEVSLDGLDVGDQILASQLELPEGSTLAIEDDMLIINVTSQPTEPEPEEEVEAETEEAAAPEEEAEQADEESE